MMLLDQHQPGIHRLPLHSGLHLSVGRDGFNPAIAAEHIGSSIGGIAQHADDSSMSELAPDEFSVPNTAVSSSRKTQITLREIGNNPIGTASLSKDRKD
jgi:hypothetical protein